MAKHKTPHHGTKIKHDVVENPGNVKGTIPDSPPGISPGPKK